LNAIMTWRGKAAVTCRIATFSSACSPQPLIRSSPTIVAGRLLCL
jgi:hypothetical protein